MDIHPDIDHAMAFLLGCVPEPQWPELAEYLSKSLEKEMDADLKGILNRSIKDAYFSSRGARTFFEGALRTVNRSLKKV